MHSTKRSGAIQKKSKETVAENSGPRENTEGEEKEKGERGCIARWKKKKVFSPLVESRVSAFCCRRARASGARRETNDPRISKERPSVSAKYEIAAKRAQPSSPDGNVY